MAFADPISISYAGDTVTLVRLPSQGTTGVFYSAEDTAKITIAHQSGKRNRDTVRLEKRLSPDPVTGAIRTATAYVVFDSPLDADPDTIVSLNDALCGFMTATGSSNFYKVIGGEA